VLLEIGFSSPTTKTSFRTRNSAASSDRAASAEQRTTDGATANNIKHEILNESMAKPSLGM